jgi:hypothetical protein
MIIGVSGQFRQGKDKASDHIADRMGLGRDAFAFGVKSVFCEYFGVDMDFVERWKVVDEAPPGFLLSVRRSLQLIGDGFRTIKDDVWIEALFRRSCDKVVVSDVRYRNELATIKSRGGLNLLVYRPGFMNDDPNGSEAQIRPFVEHFLAKGKEGRVESEGEFDLVDFFVLNDGGLDDFYAKLDALVVPFLKRPVRASCVLS